MLNVREVDGELEVTVETEQTVVGCTGCGARAESQGRRTVVVRDVDAFGRRGLLRWVKRLWRCPELACPARTWTEQHLAVGPRAALTERAREQACRRVGRDGASVALVARDLGVGWHTVRRWETEILAWHTTGGASNGPTEAANLLIKKIKRVGHGFRNFDNYRLRLLLHCGVDWQDQPAARLRQRQPRSAA